MSRCVIRGIHLEKMMLNECEILLAKRHKYKKWNSTISQLEHITNSSLSFVLFDCENNKYNFQSKCTLFGHTAI